MDLANAETESAVIYLLDANGYWNNPDNWRYFGDLEDNYSTIGNQQSRPEAALVEKLVNSVDAVLMAECIRRGVNPEGPDAPRSTTEFTAVGYPT